MPPSSPGTATVVSNGDHRLAALSNGKPVALEMHGSSAPPEVALSVEQFSLWYGASQVLFDVSLPVARHGVTALIGASGCGKSTLLRSVNRLNDLVENVTVQGTMHLNGSPVYGPGVDVIALRKRMGMVFQRPNPFPMSIFENVVYPLRVDGIRDRRVLDEECERSLRAAALWGEVKDRLRAPALALSGGQQQRLCVARAIAGRPEVLLLDEPCSALDPIAGGQIEDLIDALKGSHTVLLVTHNMQQAARISDYTAFMMLGRLVEFGPTASLFLKPHRKETQDYVTGRLG